MTLQLLRRAEGSRHQRVRIRLLHGATVWTLGQTQRVTPAIADALEEAWRLAARSAGWKVEIAREAT